MNIVTKNIGIPQIRCKALSGGAVTPFRYEVRVHGQWVPSNHSFAAWVVENAAILFRSGVQA